MSKSNSFVKNFKNINKIINNLLEENLNKLKFKNLINLLRNNKIVLTIVALVILFLSYLLIPTLYNQDEISKKLKFDLLQKMNLNFKFNNKINYNFFPRPHFTITDSVISFNNQEISKIRKLKIYIGIDNLFSLNNVSIDNLLIEDANFDLNNENYYFFIKLLKNNYKNIQLKIKNSNIFFKNSEQDILFINKILYMKYYYDQKELKNLLISNNEIFNFPYEIKLSNDNDKKKLISILNFNFSKFKIQNELDYNGEIKEGKVDIIYKKSKSNIIYKTNSKFFEFNFFDKKEKQSFLYTGKINLKPFFSRFEGKTQKLNLSFLFNVNSFIPQVLKSGILNKENIDLEINIKADNIFDNMNLINFDLNSNIKEGLIDIDQTKYEWNDYAKFKLTDSLVYEKDGQLILDAKLEININNINEIYTYLLTPKNLRKNINKIVLNFSYNFDQNTTNFRDIRIDNKYNQNVNKIISTIILKENKLQNKIYLKNLINKALKYYSG